MLKKIIILLLLSVPVSLMAKSEGPLDAGMVNPGHEEKPVWFKNSFLDLREDVSEAADEDRRVLLYFYQDGCPYCSKLLQDNFAQQAISEKTQANYDVIAINMWGDREVLAMEGDEVTEKAFAKKRKIMFTPTMLFIDEQGEDVLRINGYYPPHKFDLALDYASAGHARNESFRDFLARKDPAPASGKLHIQPEYLRPPYQLNSIVGLSDKPLMVLFEQKQCAACDELHLDILKRPESVEQTGRLNIVLFDTWADTPVVTPDGQKTKVSEWAKSLNIQYTPSLVFFDKSGAEVFRAEGYLRAFHIQSVMEYVSSGAYLEEPEFQRFVDARADALREQGIEVDLMK